MPADNDCECAICRASPVGVPPAGVLIPDSHSATVGSFLSHVTQGKREERERERERDHLPGLSFRFGLLNRSQQQHGLRQRQQQRQTLRRRPLAPQQEEQEVGVCGAGPTMIVIHYSCCHLCTQASTQVSGGERTDCLALAAAKVLFGHVVPVGRGAGGHRAHPPTRATADGPGQRPQDAAEALRQDLPTTTTSCSVIVVHHDGSVSVVSKVHTFMQLRNQSSRDSFVLVKHPLEASK